MKYKLAQLAEIIDGDRGVNYPKQNEFQDEGYCLFLDAGNVTVNGFSFDSNQFITERKHHMLRKGVLEYDDIVYTTRGTIGNVAYYGNKTPYPHVRINSGMVILRTRQDIENPLFLYHLLRHKNYRAYVTQYSTGSAQPQLPIKTLSKISLDIPPLARQTKIASILSAYDNLIENNQKRIKLLEQMAQRLYQEWFVRFRFPGYETTKFVDGIPQGWEYGKISSFYDTTAGGTPSRVHSKYYDEGTIPWIKTGEIKDSIILETEEYITEEAIKYSAAKIMPRHSIIMAMYGVNIGYVGYLGKDMACNQAGCVFQEKNVQNSNHYLFQYLRAIREYLNGISFGAAQQNLSQKLIQRIKILMPDRAVLNLFNEKVDIIYHEIELLLRQNQNLTKQRDPLLPRLMSGKLAV